MQYIKSKVTQTTTAKLVHYFWATVSVTSKRGIEGGDVINSTVLAIWLDLKGWPLNHGSQKCSILFGNFNVIDKNMYEYVRRKSSVLKRSEKVAFAELNLAE